MALTRSLLRTEMQATGFGTDSASVTRQNNWLDVAYTWAWNARDPQGVPIRWSFHYMDQQSLSVTAGSASPTMPTDFGTVEWVEDNQGSKLVEMDPETFDDLFAAGTAQGVTGQPYAYKVVNRQLVLGPTPSSSGTYKWTYRRRVSHYDNSSAVVAGTLSADTDYPLWPADHHLILVFAACAVGHGLNSNPAAVTMEGLRDEALLAMRADLGAEFAPAQVWGDGGWSSSGW